jgi:hypothetical protein
MQLKIARDKMTKMVGWLLAGALILGCGTIASAQSVGGPPSDIAPEPLPVRTDLTPRIPSEFNRPVRDYHVVKSGDTLFGISQGYFGSPYLWPILWSFNGHITNPHWIYPGDVVYLRAPLPGDAPFDENNPTPLQMADRGLSVAVGGFITGRAVSSVGKLEYSPEGKDMLTFPDRVYFSLNTGENQRVKRGKVYAILRSKGFVYEDGDEDKPVGTKFHIVGAVRVVETGEGGTLHTAVVVQAWEEIYRGDLLFPYERQLLRVAPSVATKTVVGEIVDTISRADLFGQHFYVFLNRGENHDVRVGNRFFAYFRSDGRSSLDEDDVRKLPFERVAQILVIQTEDNYSTGLVVQSRRELDVGFRVEMYEGF